MPMVDSNNAALWDGGPQSLYRAGDGRGYERATLPIFYGNDVETLIAALESKGLLKSHRLVLLGAGLGYSVERFVAAGYGPVADGTANGKLCAVDTSAYLQGIKAAN